LLRDGARIDLVPPIAGGWALRVADSGTRPVVTVTALHLAANDT